MNQESRIYVPYVQFISNIHKLNEETAKELIIKIAEFCLSILDIDSLSKSFDKKFMDISIHAEEEKILYPIYNSKNKIDAMSQLAFLVNKCTKPNSIKEEEKLGISNEQQEKFGFIFSDINSNDEKTKRKAINQLLKFTEEEFIAYYNFNELENRKKIFYDIKHCLLSSIIKELSVNPELYKNYEYGFIRDENDEENISYIFAINIPEHLGTYQFHIEPNHEREILFDIECYEVQHKYEQLAEGNRPLGKMSFLFSKDEIKDVSRLETILNNLKIRENRITNLSENNSEDIFRKIFFILYY